DPLRSNEVPALIVILDQIIIILSHDEMLAPTTAAQHGYGIRPRMGWLPAVPGTRGRSRGDGYRRACEAAHLRHALLSSGIGSAARTVAFHARCDRPQAWVQHHPHLVAVGLLQPATRGIPLRRRRRSHEHLRRVRSARFDVRLSRKLTLLVGASTPRNACG